MNVLKEGVNVHMHVSRGKEKRPLGKGLYWFLVYMLTIVL